MWRTLLFLGLYLGTACPEHDGRVVCYYANWSGDRLGDSKFSIDDIDPFLCTHLIYAFVRIDDNGTSIVSMEPERDVSSGGFAKLNQLKRLNPELKTLVSIGGWKEGVQRYAQVAGDKTLRLKFIQDIIWFLREHKFDGVDLAWQYPTSRVGSTSKDKENYARLLEEMRNAFEKDSTLYQQEPLLISAVMSGLPDTIDDGFDIEAFNRNVDFINVICYDYYMASGVDTQHHAKLYPSAEDIGSHIDSALNADASIKHILKRGMSPHKVNLGIPTYGRLFKLEDPKINGLGATTGGNGLGGTTNEPGYSPYLEICRNVKEAGWNVRHENASSMGPYAFKDDLWVCYDDEKSAALKGSYARAHGLGGIDFWTLDHDDFRGFCSGVKFPLIKSASAAFRG